jgi:NAD(P)-dependent dehydrogenase (short-subunit alcohol dehydrogenase family)
MSVETYNSLGGQVALVTGATRGIGAAIAADLSNRGATVYAGAREPEDVSDPNLLALELDLTEEDVIVDAINRIDDEKGRLDILVNNAGVMDSRSALAEMPTTVIDETLDTNLRGPLVLTKYALPLLLWRDGSRVVNVSSALASLRGDAGRGMPAYRISKSGLNAMTAYLDAEYRRSGPHRQRRQPRLDPDRDGWSRRRTQPRGRRGHAGLARTVQTRLPARAVLAGPAGDRLVSEREKPSHGVSTEASGSHGSGPTEYRPLQ